MVEFGDELIIESYRVPWLIWIQFLVMVLLILLLFFGFAVSINSDPSTTSSSSAAADAPPSNAAQLSNPISSDGIITVEYPRDSEGGRASITEDDELNGEESSLKGSMFLSIFRLLNHPCNYIQALFKCFGLGSSSTNCRHEKRE